MSIQIVACLLMLITPCMAMEKEYASAYPTFKEWAAACDGLPKFRALAGTKPESMVNLYLQTSLGNLTEPDRYKVLHLNEFARTLDSCIKTMAEAIKKSDEWTNFDAAHQLFEPWTWTDDASPFTPYVQKLVVSKEATLAMRGDLHADLHSVISFVRSLQVRGYMDPHDGFKIAAKHKADHSFYIVFLGDYVDRGAYGIEVIYTLMRLKIANPEHVILVRGNHEDPIITMQYGFFSEFCKKFGSKSYDLGDAPTSASQYHKLNKFYNLMPLALFVGAYDGSMYHFVQCCHGGIELKYDPKNLLASAKQVKYDYAEKLITRGTFNGFMWGDFLTNPNDESYDPGNGRPRTGSKDSKKYLTDRSHEHFYALHGILRAHQHTIDTEPLMKLMLENHGVAKLWHAEEKTTDLWESIVATFLLGPDMVYGWHGMADFTFDTWALLKPKGTITSWEFSLFNNEIYVPCIRAYKVGTKIVFCDEAATGAGSGSAITIQGDQVTLNGKIYTSWPLAEAQAYIEELAEPMHIVESMIPTADKKTHVIGFKEGGTNTARGKGIKPPILRITYVDDDKVMDYAVAKPGSYQLWHNEQGVNALAVKQDAPLELARALDQLFEHKKDKSVAGLAKNRLPDLLNKTNMARAMDWEKERVLLLQQQEKQPYIFETKVGPSKESPKTTPEQKEEAFKSLPEKKQTAQKSALWAELDKEPQVIPRLNVVWKDDLRMDETHPVIQDGVEKMRQADVFNVARYLWIIVTEDKVREEKRAERLKQAEEVLGALDKKFQGPIKKHISELSQAIANRVKLLYESSPLVKLEGMSDVLAYYEQEVYYDFIERVVGWLAGLSGIQNVTDLALVSVKTRGELGWSLVQRSYVKPVQKPAWTDAFTQMFKPYLACHLLEVLAKAEKESGSIFTQSITSSPTEKTERSELDKILGENLGARKFAIAFEALSAGVKQQHRKAFQKTYEEKVLEEALSQQNFPENLQRKVYQRKCNIIRTFYLFPFSCDEFFDTENGRNMLKNLLKLHYMFCDRDELPDLSEILPQMVDDLITNYFMKWDPQQKTGESYRDAGARVARESFAALVNQRAREAFARYMFDLRDREGAEDRIENASYHYYRILGNDQDEARRRVQANEAPLRNLQEALKGVKLSFSSAVANKSEQDSARIKDAFIGELAKVLAGGTIRDCVEACKKIKVGA